MNSLIKYLLVVSAILFCGQVYSGDEMIPGEKLQKMISLEFNEHAYKTERNEYLDFSIQYDTSNFIAQCSPDFSIQNNTLRVYAVEYLEKVVNQAKEGIVVTFVPKEGALEQSYDFKIVLLEQSISNGLKSNYGYVDPENTIVEYTDINYFVPMPLWQKIAIYGGSILIIVILLWFILTRDNMPFGKKTFKTGGTVTVYDVNNQRRTFTLSKSQHKYGIKILSTDRECSVDGLTISVKPIDRPNHNSKKIRSAVLNVRGALQGIVTNTKDPSVEIPFAGGKLYNKDKVIFTTLSKKEVIIKYDNSSINRQK